MLLDLGLFVCLFACLSIYLFIFIIIIIIIILQGKLEGFEGDKAAHGLLTR